MKRDAEAAELVIVNHHLFFADLALRGPHPGRVLPDYDAVIFDEAHRLEDIATEFFGVRISETRVERSLGDAERALTPRRSAAIRCSRPARGPFSSRRGRRRAHCSTSSRA